MIRCRPFPSHGPAAVLACLILAGLTLAGVAAWLPGSRDAIAQEAADPGLQESLLAFDGRFDWDADRGDYVFTDRPGLDALLGPLAGARLPALVDCIDDPRPARATLSGAPVTLGVVCYQALRQIAYAEGADSQGDLAAGWPGHIDPLATPAERLAAKRAWQAALAEGIYHLL